MSDAEADDNVEENILYDLSVNAEWPLDAETILRGAKEKSRGTLIGRVASLTTRSAWTFLRSIGYPIRHDSPCFLPAGLIKLVGCQIHWKIAVGSEGREVAVLQDHFIEIRSPRDDYASVIGRCGIARDPYPQWRQLAWSADCDILAYADSRGNVVLFDMLGTFICKIPTSYVPSPTQPFDLSWAIAGLIFKPYKGKEDWSVELIVVNYQGTLKNYLIRREGEYKESHRFLFSSHYPRGISAIVYHPRHSLLLVGGCAEAVQDDDDIAMATQQGLTAWRILSDFPHYKQVTDSQQTWNRSGMSNMKRQIIKKFKSKMQAWYGDIQDGIFKMSLSPSKDILVAIHHSGRLSLWDVPSLRCRKTWSHEEQIGDEDEINPVIAEDPRRRKQFKEHIQSYNLIDANWWSDEAVIMARGTGALTVSSIRTLRNLLGKSPEWFEPSPQVTQAQEGGFVGLECECRYSSLKRRLDEAEDDDYYEDSEDEDEATVTVRARRIIRHVLYFVTDSERFQPPRKRPKLVKRTYRLICLKSTTPEELYARKIDNEEYGEALSLAQAYGLDCDLVYQRQWRKTPVSVASIQDYLSKISKRSWVLHECLERVPENIDAMRELLQYGLRGTDLEALIAIGRGEDKGQFILCDRHDIYESFDDYEEDEAHLREQLEKKRIEELIKQVNFGNLTLEQQELCRARLKLLQYLDRLSTYEEILGGMHAAEELFDPKFFQNFRSQNIVEVAVDYARCGDCSSLDIILTYHGEHTLPHRLPILSNFPETLAPYEYRSLLPEAGDDDVAMLPWDEQSWRDKDWSETHTSSLMADASKDLGEFLYEEYQECETFRYKKILPQGVSISREQLQNWYKWRACEIEALSRNVGNALELITLGQERYVQDLDGIRDDLETMETLVYECYLEDSVTFAEFRKMSDIEKLRLMMSKSSTEMYVKNLHRWLVPFLRRCEKLSSGSYESLLEEYLVDMAKNDLSLCRKVFENSKREVSHPIIYHENDSVRLALKCVYACESNDQLNNHYAIFDCLPKKRFGVVPEETSKLQKRMEILEAQLSVAELLQKNGLPQTLAFIQESQDDKEKTVQLMTKLTRTAGRSSPPLSEMQWKKLLIDIVEIQKKVYHCVDVEVCYEIFTESLLCSSRHDNIRLAGEMIDRSATEPLMTRPAKAGNPMTPLLHRVPYRQAVELVLQAAREYFDSSANLTDPCMDLARACLNLITDNHPSISEELDLIESLGLLDGFGVQVLPLQVRLSKDRLGLVKSAINNKPNAYKKIPKLLKLGHLLRVGGGDEKLKEGCVQQLIAQTGLQAKDYKLVSETCYKLMEVGFAPIWKECKSLAEAEEFGDIQAKSDLLCFAVTHCTPDMIEPILRAKCLLDTQVLYEKVHAQVEGSSDDSSSSSSNAATPSPRSSSSPFSTRGAILQTKEILSSTTKTTQAVLATVSDKKWWGKTMKSLDSLWHRKTQQGALTEEYDDQNVKLEKQGCHPFYGSEISDAYLNVSEASFAQYSIPSENNRGLCLSECVLRTAKLEETLTEGETVQSSTEVLLGLAKDCIAKDTTLGLSYLLALPKATDADSCLSSLPQTAISLQIAVYYYALQLYVKLYPDSQPNMSEFYNHAPSKLIQHVLYVTRKEKPDWLDGVQELVEKLKHYEELLADYNQAQVLKNLGRGVDIGRFTSDNEYKHETILGLAMTLEQPVYDIAVSLADRYKLPVWEVYMTHLEFLFSDSGLSTEEIETRVKQLGILPTLIGQPESLHKCMNTYVYPTIEGTDHNRLMYYYSILENCEVEGGIITASSHVKMLKKLKSAAPGLDYKLLTNSSCDPLDILHPVLTSENVNTIAKLAAKIPNQDGDFLESGLVYAAWAVKLFWDGDQPNKKKPNNTAEWLHHRYEPCGEHMLKMSPSNVTGFIDSAVFDERSLEELNMDCRVEIVKRALKFCRQQMGKKKKVPTATLR